MTTTDVKQTDTITAAAPGDVKNGHHAAVPTDAAEPVRRPLQPGERYPEPPGPPIPDHPLAPLAGVFNDEPLWDDLQEEIRKYRKWVDEQENAE